MDDRKARNPGVSEGPEFAAKVLGQSRQEDEVSSGTGRGRGLFGSLLPRRMRWGHEVLDQAIRRRIYEHIRAHPGRTSTQVKVELSLSKGGLAHHLEVLKREGLVRTRLMAGKTMLYAVGTRPPPGGGDRPLVQERLLLTLIRWPGTTVSDVAGILGISRQLATHHARMLAQQGLVRLERRDERLCAIPIRGSVPPSMKLPPGSARRGLENTAQETRDLIRRSAEFLLPPRTVRPARLRDDTSANVS